MLHQIFLFLHLVCAIAWIGGMFFAYFCLRPAAAEVLDPPKRLPLWAAAFSRFLPYVGIAVLLLIATGLGLLAPVGMARAPLGWHLMLTLGLVMSAVYAYIYWALFPRLRAQCTASAWPDAGQTLNRIRRLVALNLGLGVLVVAAAVSAR